MSGVENESAHFGRLCVAAVVEVADEDGDHVVERGRIALSGLAKDAGAAASADAEERRECVDEDEVVVHGGVPFLKELGALGREQVAEVLWLEAVRRRPLRKHWGK